MQRRGEGCWEKHGSRLHAMPSVDLMLGFTGTKNSSQWTFGEFPLHPFLEPPRAVFYKTPSRKSDVFVVIAESLQKGTLCFHSHIPVRAEQCLAHEHNKWQARTLFLSLGHMISQVLPTHQEWTLEAWFPHLTPRHSRHQGQLTRLSVHAYPL